MKTLEVWKWRVRGPTGRVHVTRYRMTEAEALQRDPRALRVPGTCEVREVPESAAELARLTATITALPAAHGAEDVRTPGSRGDRMAAKRRQTGIRIIVGVTDP